MTTHRLSAATKIQALSRCRVFSGVGSDALGVLAEMMDSESLDSGELLFAYGEPSERVYVVVSGRLSVLVPERDEAVRSLGPAELLGEYGMFASQIRTASVRANEACVLLSLPYERFRSFLQQFPDATLALLATTVARLIEAERS